MNNSDLPWWDDLWKTDSFASYIRFCHKIYRTVKDTAVKTPFPKMPGRELAILLWRCRRRRLFYSEFRPDHPVVLEVDKHGAVDRVRGILDTAGISSRLVKERCFFVWLLISSTDLDDVTHMLSVWAHDYYLFYPACYRLLLLQAKADNKVDLDDCSEDLTGLNEKEIGLAFTKLKDRLNQQETPQFHLANAVVAWAFGDEREFKRQFNRFYKRVTRDISKSKEYRDLLILIGENGDSLDRTGRVDEVVTQRLNVLKELLIKSPIQFIEKVADNEIVPEVYSITIKRLLTELKDEREYRARVDVRDELGTKQDELPEIEIPFPDGKIDMWDRDGLFDIEIVFPDDHVDIVEMKEKLGEFYNGYRPDRKESSTKLLETVIELVKETDERVTDTDIAAKTGMSERAVRLWRKANRESKKA
jgi:hypothetical protein